MNNKTRRTLLFLALAIVSGIIVIQSGILDYVFWLMIAGVVPGTDIVISATTMLIIYLIVGAITVAWAIKKELYPGSPSIRKAQYEANKKAAARYNRKIAVEKRRQAKKVSTITTRRQRYSG